MFRHGDDKTARVHRSCLRRKKPRPRTRLELTAHRFERCIQEQEGARLAFCDVEKYPRTILLAALLAPASAPAPAVDMWSQRVNWSRRQHQMNRH